MARAKAKRGSTRKPYKSPVDVHVGSRVRLRRNMLGFSQEKLGEALGLTFQQVQKYERGANRIGASLLYELHQILGVPVQFFYDHADPVRARPAVDAPPEALFPPAAQAVAADFARIGSERVRRSLMQLAKALAGD